MRKTEKRDRGFEKELTDSSKKSLKEIRSRFDVGFN